VTQPARTAAEAGRPPAGGQWPGRREYLAALLAGAAGAALVLISVRQGWARVVTIEPRPLPVTSVSVRGQDLVPAAGALGLAALAGLAAVIATRGTARRVIGGVLVAFAAGMVLAVSQPLTDARVRAAARVAPAAGPAGASTVDNGTTAGSTGVSGLSLASHVTMSGFPWRWLVLLGALAVLAAGVLAAWRGPRWPVMSGRYERPARAPGAGRPAEPGASPATLWESLNQGIDPTDPGPEKAARPDGGLNGGLS
jgi:uncharacterized membrane protein (TIGR02234 family)